MADSLTASVPGFGKLSNRVLGLLRSFGRREQEFRVRPQGQYISDYSLFAAYGYQGMEENLRLEYDLMGRYADYEDMDDYVETSGALDLYADESTQPDPETGKSLWIEADVGDIKDKLDHLFTKRLKIEEEIWEISRSLCKWGNNFEELLLNDDGVVGLSHLPAPSVRRIEKDKGFLLGFVQSITGTGFTLMPEQFEKIMENPKERASYQDAQNALFEDWQVAHFRFRSKLRRSRYGYSVLEPARWIWKRLLLLEDAALIYRLTRSPSRYVFTVDVGNVPRNEIPAYLERMKNQLKKKKIVDPKTGKLSMRFNPLAYDEDFFLPSVGGTDLAKVDTLNGPTFPVMEDIEYFLKKLHTALKIPSMGDDEAGTKAALTMRDVRWARTIMRVQRELRNGLKRIGNTHLVALGIDPAAVDWEIVMVTPSQIFELAQLEVRNARVEFADRMEKWVSNYWIMRNVFGYSDEEIFAIQKQRQKESEGDGAISPDEKPRKRREGEDPSKSLVPAGGGRMEPGWIFGANHPPRRRMQPITEEWLFKGGKRDHEKWVEDNFRTVMRTQKGMASRLSETRELMMEIKAALATRRFSR